jgi:3-oxoacid CoA-transferase B subunit
LEDLGALEVDEKGDIANWLVPGKRPTGMGGAMDLLVGAKRVVVMMEHNAKDGSTKLVKECTLPLSAVGAVNRVITEKGVFDIDERGFVLREISPLVTVEELQRLTGADFTVAEDLQPMFGEVNSRV